jgi:hypothetical protein
MCTVTEEGGGLAVEYKYRLNPKSVLSSSSSTAVGGFITTNRSWGAGLYQSFSVGGKTSSTDACLSGKALSPGRNEQDIRLI